MRNSEAEQHSDFRNHPQTHHFSHSISLKKEIRLLKSSSLT
ncbi:hypothetical protein T4B_6516 [Trichinella pseudospiralis]|uniref:Uncharacterized protein n=1 Tax=Trichinella pseudospiralis TaxID=6337 RepID=A0A0V1GFD3_TRIPS|nr:hypothetical protein T4B_1248 [Trichinella pseudospiralis]KRY96499.1 hypothetical protein T4B_6516 [Trichinella pseudospiralis]